MKYRAIYEVCKTHEEETRCITANSLEEAQDLAFEMQFNLFGRVLRYVEPAMPKNGLCRIKSAFVKDGRVREVTVSVQVGDGIGYHIIGLPDTAVKETLLRVLTALQASDYRVPGKKVVICVEPLEEVKGNFSCFDLPIAAALLEVTAQASFMYDDGVIVYGELSIDGRLRAAGGEREVIEHVRGEKGGLFAGSADGCQQETTNRALIGFESLRHFANYAETCKL